ncbi:iron ABC transporter permease [Paenibacillaceae bacterium]|nr:iron ABC transporter permease [Paenibacillaceae bacterium]
MDDTCWRNRFSAVLSATQGGKRVTLIRRNRLAAFICGFWLTFVVLLLVLTILVVLHIALGKTMMTPEQVVKALLNRSDDAGMRHIVWNLRLPRVLVATAAGLMLGLAGAVLQVVLRNPLVEPGLVGATAGCVLFVVLWMLYAPVSYNTPKNLPLVALIGGIITVAAIYFLNGHGENGRARLALTGVVATAIIQSVTSLLLLKNQQGLSAIFLWNFGSLNGRVWQHWNIVWPWCLTLIPLTQLYARKARLLQLEDAVGIGLGLAVNRTRLTLLLLAAALTAAAVSVVGAIGFIGLVGPHIAALLVGRNPVHLFPTSALFTAVLLVAADWAAQGITLKLPFPGMEHHVTSLPVGAVTTIMGAPFFLYLLRKTLVKKR